MTFEEQMKEEANEMCLDICQYLLTREDIREKLDNPNKSIGKMFKYIRKKAEKMQKEGCAMVHHTVVYGWAVHYWDEDELDEEIEAKPSSTTAVEPKESAKTESKPVEKPVKKPKKAEKKAEEYEQLMLF